MIPLEVLLRHPLFALAPPSLVRSWRDRGQALRLPTGETVFREGSSGEWAYVIVQGRVRVLRVAGSGREVTLGTLQASELFGEYALLPPGLNTASCRAASDCELLQLPLEPVRKWIKETPLFRSGLKNWLQLHFLVRHLRGQPFLGFMSAPSALAMLPHLTPLSVAPLRALQADGLCEDRWLFLEEGEVLVESPGEPVRTLTTGASLGERALAGVGGLPVAVALGPTRVLCLPREFFVRPDRPALTSWAQSYAAEVLESPSRVRWIGQREMADCGPACLAMLAYYHELPFGPDEVRARIQVGPDGATVGELLRAAVSLGFSSQAVRVEAGQLRHVHVPAIVHQANNHYVALFRLDANGVFLGDPATGLVTVSFTHFVKSLSGTILLLRPAPSVVKTGGQNPSEAEA